MTYSDSAALMNDFDFKGRVKVACLTFATYIMGEPIDTDAHSSRLRWAQQVFQNSDMVASQVQPPTVMTTQVQTDGKNVSDANLQTAVESVVNKML